MKSHTRIIAYIVLFTSVCLFLFACSQPSKTQSLPEPEYDVIFDHDIALYDKNDITVAAKGFVFNGERGGDLYIEIVNNGQMDIGVRVHPDSTVNGFPTGFTGTTENGMTYAGDTNLYAISFEDKELDPAITQIETIILKLYIDNNDKDHPDPGILDESDPVTINIR